MSHPLFEKVSTARRYESVVRQVLTLIASGDLAPGARLPAERDFAERLGVSRNVLREAIRVLEVRGILISRAGGGRHIRPSNLSSQLSSEGVVLQLEQEVISDVLEARELLEVQVARLAAERATDQQIAALPLSGDSWSDNISFHTALAETTGNFMLPRLVQLQMDLLQDIHQRDHYRSAQTKQDLLAEHKAIVDAVAARNPDAAEAAVRMHFTHTREAVEGM